MGSWFVFKQSWLQTTWTKLTLQTRHTHRLICPHVSRLQIEAFNLVYSSIQPSLIILLLLCAKCKGVSCVINDVKPDDEKVLKKSFYCFPRPLLLPFYDAMQTLDKQVLQCSYFTLKIIQSYLLVFKIKNLRLEFENRDSGLYVVV